MNLFAWLFVPVTLGTGIHIGDPVVYNSTLNYNMIPLKNSSKDNSSRNSSTPVGSGIDLHDDLPFFKQIQHLNLDWDDIVGLYRNVSAELETEQCKNKCKTAIAFWVLQSLKPCHLIRKMDCPKGLLCCIYEGETEEMKELEQLQQQQQLQQQSQDKDIGSSSNLATNSSVHGNNTYEEQWVDPEPILDPIPEEEPHQFEITELNTS